MTGSATAVLIRWSKGHVYVGGGGAEVYVNMAAVASKKQATAYGDTILAGQGGVLSTEAVQGVAYWSPDGGSRYPPLLLSDYDGRRVVGYTASMGADERTVITPTLNDPVFDKGEELRRRIERASADTVSLWGSPRREPPNQGGGEGSSPPEFSVSGLLTDLLEDPIDSEGVDRRESSWWQPKANWNGAWVSASLKNPGRTSSHVQFLRVKENGPSVTMTVIAGCFIAGGKRLGIVPIPNGERVRAGEPTIMRLVSAGAGASDLTVSVHGAPL